MSSFPRPSAIDPSKYPCAGFLSLSQIEKGLDDSCRFYGDLYPRFHQQSTPIAQQRRKIQQAPYIRAPASRSRKSDPLLSTAPCPPATATSRTRSVKTYCSCTGRGTKWYSKQSSQSESVRDTALPGISAPPSNPWDNPIFRHLYMYVKKKIKATPWESTVEQMQSKTHTRAVQADVKLLWSKSIATFPKKKLKQEDIDQKTGVSSDITLKALPSTLSTSINFWNKQGPYR